MGIKANDLDHDLKNFKKEDQTIATVEAEEDVYKRQDDHFSSRGPSVHRLP